MINVYVDTSVFGGVFDDEFSAASSAFFELVRQDRFGLLVSDVTLREIGKAPQNVRSLFDDHLVYLRIVPMTAAVLELRDQYIEAGIVGPKWLDDAAHVAAATIAEVDLIVSWNFRHIVHFDKIRLYNEVNTRKGFKVLDIRSPLEVVDYEDEEEV